MAKKDASKFLGGMSGKAANILRGRQSKIDAALGRATGAKKKAKKKAKR